MIPLFDDEGRRTNATALTALVMRAAGSDIVQVLDGLIYNIG